MDRIVVHYIEKPELDEPVFIEGLPGVGNVGKLVAEHLIDELGAKKFADIYSKYFPPQVLVNNDGTIKLVNNELYYWKAKNMGQKDLLFLTGDYQGLTPEGQYELSDTILKILQEHKVKRIYTIGGYSMGRAIRTPRVLGAATDQNLVKEMKKYGIRFLKGELGSGIVGASGLLLGLGKLYGMNSVCLMGETSGYFVDPKSAQAVLRILTKILRVDIDFSKLERKAVEIDRITSKLREIEEMGKIEQKPDDLGYFG